jgi:hypothetical protein
MSSAIRMAMHTDSQAVLAIILSIILITVVYYVISTVEVNNTTTAIFQQANAMTIYSSSSSSSSSSSAYYFATAVRSEDHPPTAYSQSIQTTQNTPLAISFKAADPDSGDTIGYAILSQPSHGQLSNLNSAFSDTIHYSPNNGFSGTDSFSVQAFDRNRLVSNVATIYITVIRVDHPPTAYSQSIQTTQNTPVAIHLSAIGSDPGDSITSFAIVSMPSRGTITNFDQSSGALIYTPYHGVAQGTDMFTFNTIDNRGTVSNIGVVSISINRGLG